MQQTYSHLLTFRFKHRYFKDDLFKSIDISFTDETNKLTKDLDIIIKYFQGGMHLLASDPELLETLNDATPLQFYITCKDSLYINYTELPNFNLAEKLIYFNNLSGRQVPQSNEFILQKEDFVGENEIIKINHGKIKIPSFDANKAYRFTDSTGNEISSACISQSAQHSDEFNLSGIPQGLVHIFADKEEVDKLFFNPKTVWKKPLGIIEIYTGRLFTQYKEKGLINYNVVFNNRQTIWKYFFVSPVFQKFNNLSIINKAKEQIFNAPQKQNVFNNPETLVFESRNKIPLSELSDDNYQLVDNYDFEHRSGKIILKNLTKASPEQLYCDNTKSDKPVYSHIYI